MESIIQRIIREQGKRKRQILIDESLWRELQEIKLRKNKKTMEEALTEWRKKL